jgi:hypothetical protein
MTNRSRFLHGTAVAALFGPLVLACGSIGPTLQPPQVAAVRATVTQTHIPERQITIMWVQSNAGGGLGLMGAVINGAVSRGRKNAAEDMARPLQAQTQDVNYAGMFWTALDPTLGAVPWLKSAGLKAMPSAVEEPNSEVLARHSVLRMGTDYQLSVDSSTLIVQTGLGFYEAGGSGSPAAATVVYYRSEKVAPIEDEKAVAVWSADRAMRLRLAMAESVAESMKLIHLALLCMGGANCPAGGGHHMRFRLNEGRGDFGSLVGVVESDGIIVEEGPTRVVFRGVDGAFYSVPKSAVENQVGHGPPPAPPAMPPPPPPSAPGPQAPQ